MRSFRSPSPLRNSPALGLLLVFLLSLLPSCPPGGFAVPAPSSGLPQYQEIATVTVPGALVNIAGGNLIATRADLSIETRLGEWAIGATYNSASGQWLWNFDIAYDGTSFLDATGATHDTSALSPGDAIPGTAWVVVDADTMKTKGGLAHDFDLDGRLAAIHWTSSDYPRLSMTSQVIAGGPHTTAIDQCTSAVNCSNVFTIDYDIGTGELISITDRAGRLADFSYDIDGNLETARDGLDTAQSWPGFRYEYTGTLLTAITNSEGERIEYSYTGNQNRINEVRAIGEENPVYLFVYRPKSSADGWHNTSFFDPLGKETVFYYDDQRRVWKTVDPVSDEVQFSWVGNRISSKTLPSGVTTTWTYANDDVATATLPSGNVLDITYEPNGVNRDGPFARPVLRIDDNLGLVEEYGYDPQGRLTSVTNGAGETTAIEYGSDQMIWRITEPDGVATELSSYGEHGEPTMVTIGDSEYERVYDAVGNLVEGMSFEFDSGPGLGGVVSRTFDEDRNVASVDLADQDYLGSTSTQTLTIEHRSDRRRTWIQRPYGGDTEFRYDALGRMFERREKASGVGHADWQSALFEYDALGRLTATERPNGMREETDYDDAGRIGNRRILRDTLAESEATFSYEDGRLTSVLDTAYGTPETYTYDDADRIESVTYPDGEWKYYYYDDRSRPVSAVYWPAEGPYLRYLGFSYDGADRETVVRDNGQPVLTRAYVDGRIDSITYGNGLVRTFAYDPDYGDLTGAETRQGTTLVESTTVDTDRTAIDAWVTTHTDTYGTLHKISGEQYWVVGPETQPDSKKSGPRVVVSYDEVGNREDYDHDELSNVKQKTVTTANPQCGDVWWSSEQYFNYNTERNRLLDIEIYPTCASGAHQYSYDEAGFVTSRDGVSIEWNAAGRVTSIGGLVSFVWDTQGRLVSRFVAGFGEQRRLFGGAVEADSYGTPTALDLGEVRIDLVTGEHLYRHFDFRGNVKLTSNEQGELRAYYEYSAYGVRKTYGDTGSNEENRSFARGIEYAGLLMLGARLYDEDAARFLSPDPVYQLINQYSYTLGNPIWFWDAGGSFSSVIGRIGHVVHGVECMAAGAWAYAFGAIGLVAASPGLAVAEGVGYIASGGEFQNVTGKAVGAVNTAASGLIKAGANEVKAGVQGTTQETTQGTTQGTTDGTTTEPAKQKAGEKNSSPLPDVLGQMATLQRWRGGPRHTPASASVGVGGVSIGGGGGGGGGCAPAYLATSIPNLGWLLFLLIPSQLLLGWLLLRRRRGVDREGG